jgi:hypothetical protein
LVLVGIVLRLAGWFALTLISSPPARVEKIQKMKYYWLAFIWHCERMNPVPGYRAAETQTGLPS